MAVDRFQPTGTPTPGTTGEVDEDITIGDSLTTTTFTVDKDEMVEFAKRWDPVPIHIDEAAAQAAVGGLFAPGLYVLAIKQRLAHELPEHAVIASFGYDEVRFHEPLRPNDVVHLVSEVVEKRDSKSKPDRGVVKAQLSLVNQSGSTLMSHFDTFSCGGATRSPLRGSGLPPATAISGLPPPHRTPHGWGVWQFPGSIGRRYSFSLMECGS